MPHVPLYASPEFEGTSDRGLYGDVIQELDWSVGEILSTLETQGLLENTLVVFSSDNGPWHVMREHGGSAGGLREGKMFTFDGGQRVPTVAMWPAVIKPSQTYTGLATMMDWMSTAADISGAPLPTDRAFDGESLLPIFHGIGTRDGSEFLFYDPNNKLEGFRQGDWKIKLAYAGFKGAHWKKGVAPHPLLLINLRDDPAELNNLAAQHPKKVTAMLAAMNALHDSKGPFPPPIPYRSNPDESHYKYLEKTYGKDFYDF